ncbi:E3 ubiquitin-protein ligase complex slx8-rfp subunit slx8 [Colletotrichum sp. SAR 10_65]|nr:E3 ubiquitin-protein ligase complex slx8-rfp subunit slx8 [Colletotrichum sp. SAR 10_65]
MPGLIPFLPTPPLPQPTRTASSSIARPVNNFLSADRGPARGSSSQAPIELDSDSEPTPGPQSATTNASTTTTASTTELSQPQPQNNIPWDLWNWAALTPDSTQQPPQALPSFSDFAANLDLDTLDATLLSAAAPHTPAREPNSDDFLSALVDGNFSSPSSYPQSAQASSGNRSSNGASTQNHLGSLRPNRPAPTLPNTVSTAAGPRRSTPRPSVFDDNDIEESLFVSSDNEPEDIMPVQTRRRASTIISSDNDPDEVVPTTTTRKRAAPSSTAARGAPTSTKRRRTSQTSATRARTTSTAPRATPTKIEDDDDIFGDKEFEKGKGKEEKDEDAIDLVASNEVPQELLVPKEDKRIKLSAFTCVICMDDVTALTVTHCGHLFCSECLHSALNVDATKNKCPICRQKVETKDRSDYTSKTKGFWPLELKLMTASRKGKQKA